MIAPPVTRGRWFPLEDRAVFRITGPDRVRFLNGQVTNDVSGPLDQESVAACLCTIKGKVEALVWIRADGDSLLLDGELKQRDSIHARLERYLIADDCEIIDETGETRLFHHFIEDVPGVISRRLALAGRDLVLRADDILPFDSAGRITADELKILALLAAIPESGHEITGEEFPAELGLDRLAVSFHKGCYLGQEIISRIESVGRIRRRLRVIQSDVPFSAGASVENDRGETGVSTRGSTELGEKTFLSMAIFKLNPGVDQPNENEPDKVNKSAPPQ